MLESIPMTGHMYCAGLKGHVTCLDSLHLPSQSFVLYCMEDVIVASKLLHQSTVFH